MFIFNRSMAAVAGALGVAFLMIGLERACDRLSAPVTASMLVGASAPGSVVATSAPVGAWVSAPTGTASAPAAAPTHAPVFTAPAPPRGAVASAPVVQLVTLQGERFQRMSSPSRLQRNPETFPSAVR